MVSIIVPVYRAENWLPRCVESILAQSYGDWELLLIDDGSPDGSGDICDAYGYRDARIRVLHQKNQGPAAARNAGMDMARGAFITFCDADDAWEPEHLQNLMEAAVRTGAEMVSCNYKVVDEQGNFLRQSQHISGIVSLKTEKDRVDYMLHQVLGWKTGWEVWSRLFSASLIREHCIRFCETCGGYGEDLAFVLNACLYADTICGIEAATYHYRIHPSSITGSSQPVRNVNSLNEAALHVWHRYGAAITEPALRALFPILHHGILRGEYEKIPAAEFPGALEHLEKEDWFMQQVQGLLRQKNTLRRCFGAREASRILNWARFCIHRNPLRFRLEKMWHPTDRNLTCGVNFTTIMKNDGKGKGV